MVDKTDTDTESNGEPRNRSTDAGGDSVHFRAQSRIFRMNDNEWYFSTREGDNGPFQSESDAQRELDTYIKLLATPSEPEKPKPREQKESPSNIDKRVWDQFDLLN